MVITVFAIAIVSLLKQDRIAQWRIQWAEHRRLLDLQHQCESWSLPRRSIVLEPDPLSARQIINGIEFHPMLVSAADQPVVGAARRDLRWEALHQAITPAAQRNREPGALVFSHRRMSPAGHDRVVVVEYFAGWAFFVTVIERGSWLGSPPKRARIQDPHRRVLYVAEPGLRLFAGSPDSADRSAFVIDYEIGPTQGTLRGQLCDDDTVLFRPSTGTITSPAPGNYRLWFPTSQPAGQSPVPSHDLRFPALPRAAGTASIGGMADQKQNQNQTQDKPPGDARNPGADDDVRHAPESGEPTETGPKSQRAPNPRGERAGNRDESGRQGREE